MVRVDPNDGRMLGRVSMPFGVATNGFLVDGRDLWFTGTRLVRTDVALGREVDRYPLSSDPDDDGLTGIARGAGSLWIARHQAGELLRVDPATGKVQQRFRQSAAAYQVAYGDGGAWVVTGNQASRGSTPPRAPSPGRQCRRLPRASPSAAATPGSRTRRRAPSTRSTARVRSWRRTDRRRSKADVLRGRDALGRQRDVGTVTGIDAATGRTSDVPLRPPAPVRCGAAREAARRGVDGAHLRGTDRRGERQGGAPDQPGVRVRPSRSGDRKATVHSFIFVAERATCAPLLGYPDAPPPRGQHLVPEVATAMPTLSRDRRTYTFTVRKGFRFAPPSNAVLDAATIRYSIERALNPKLGPRAPGIGFLGDLEGARAFHAGRADHVSGIRVHGDRISFTLTKPSPDFLERLALPYFCPVPAQHADRRRGRRQVHGAGPAGSRPLHLQRTGLERRVRDPEAEPELRRLAAAAARRDRLPRGDRHREERSAGSSAAATTRVEHYDPLLAPGGEVARRSRAPSPPGGEDVSRLPSARHRLPGPQRVRPPFSDPEAAPSRRGGTRSGIARRPSGTRRRPIACCRRPFEEPERRASRDRTASAHTDSQRQAARHRADGRAVRGRQRPPVRRRRARDARATRARRAGGNGGRRRSGAARPGDPSQLASLSTWLDYPDPASFLTQMLGKDVPARLAAGLDAHVGRPSRAPDRRRPRPRRRRRRGAPCGPRRSGRRLRHAGAGHCARPPPRLPRLERRRHGLDLAALCLRTP